MQPALKQALVRRSDAVSCELAGEAVILDMATGQYFALDPVGSRIWDLLQHVCTPEYLCERLLDEYDVDPVICRQDVAALLRDLVDRGLVKSEDAG